MKHVNVCLCGAGGVGPIILQKSAMLSAVLWIPSCPCYSTVLFSGFFYYYCEYSVTRWLISQCLMKTYFISQSITCSFISFQQEQTCPSEHIVFRSGTCCSTIIIWGSGFRILDLQLTLHALASAPSQRSCLLDLTLAHIKFIKWLISDSRFLHSSLPIHSIISPHSAAQTLAVVSYGLLNLHFLA